MVRSGPWVIGPPKAEYSWFVQWMGPTFRGHKASARPQCPAFPAKAPGIWPEPGSCTFLEHTPGGVWACTLWCLALHACLLSSLPRGGGWGPEGGAVQGGRWGCRALARELDPPCTVLQGGPRQALKGSPSPTASPDWEPLKEHLEHGRQAN